MRWALVLAMLWAALAAPAFAKGGRWHVAAQRGALAPNAGGQEAYSLKLARNEWEATVFSNQYLLAGDLPLTGVTYDWRFPICDDSCIWRFFVQAGGGISNGGPLAEITWGTELPILPVWPLPYVPAIRVDFTTQLIFIRWRAVTWSYPLWVGVSVPF